MNTVSAVFVAFLIATTMLRLLLAVRQMRHVAAHRAAIPADFAEAITLAEHQRAADYTLARTRFGVIEWLVTEVFLLLILTLGGGVAALDGLARQIAGEGMARHVLTVFAVAGVGLLAALPFDWWRTFRIEARFGFNRTTPGIFVSDLVKSIALTVLLGTPLLLAVFWLVRHAGALWWIYAWITWVLFSLLLIWAYPKWLAPLFNRFTPLAEGEIKARITDLIQRVGFRTEGLFVMDGSKRSAHGNAYFTGFGRSKRIVFFDTLVERLSVDEIEAVLAHELGHFKRGHVPKLLATRFLLALVCFAVLGALSDWPPFFIGLGVPWQGQSEIGVTLALFMLVVGVFTFPLAPFASLLSRQHEFEADAFAAAETSSARLISALVKLYRDNAATLTPDPWHSLVYDSHPPAPIRIAHLRARHAAQ
jgi:STE24 endopeptidase